MSNKKNYSIAQEAIIQEIRVIENPNVLSFLFGVVTLVNEKQKEKDLLQQGDKIQ